MSLGLGRLANRFLDLLFHGLSRALSLSVFFGLSQRVFLIAILGIQSACISSPDSTVSQNIWQTCQEDFEACATAIQNGFKFDEETFAANPPFSGDTTKNSTLNRVLTPPDSAGPQSKRLIEFGLWHLAKTPLSPLVFSNDQLQHSALKRAFFPPLWQRLVERAKTQETPLNFVIFEWMSQFIGGFGFEKSPPNPNEIARYDFFGQNQMGQITVNGRFPGGVRSSFAFAEGISVGSILLHEATHGAMTLHGPCSRSSESSCDQTLNGPYGMEILYSLAVLKSAFQAPRSDVDSPQALVVLAQRTCTSVQDRINSLPQEYWDLLRGLEQPCSITNAMEWYSRIHSALAMD